MFRGENQQGFTLIELMVALAIAIIVIALSTPISNLFKQNRVTSLEHDFVTALNLARSDAVSTATPVSVCRAAQNNPNACVTAEDGNRPWEHGWIVFNDPNTNGVIDAGEAVIQQRGALQTGYTLRVTSVDVITYNASGLIDASSAGTWSLCDPAQNTLFQRAIDISVTGRVNMLPPDEIENLNLTCLVP
ncbi:MAG: GspH/FimT family pseudopilin [Gammaproteobacteria bacterium]|nr:GspH/FimT family pseudopilin [Gammaproteobacteria bacterium]